jgi:hypothetical protein
MVIGVLNYKNRLKLKKQIQTNTITLYIQSVISLKNKMKPDKN